ncbi:lyase family protein [Paraburkholderia bryophila]|uniref:argininosuccinate lyase n=1 Tax=Paraburkholderia bryophila TaxID=420952 RepID=A0A7Y9WIF1_9BURK|nr:lyase family protein [Paraburkholderia bryophila]NYH20910.1 argininosuccinate lyase [Paraburkholderia bryophila]
MAIIYVESNTTGFGHRLLEVSCLYDRVVFFISDPARYAFLDQLPAAVNVVLCDTRSVDALREACAQIDAIRYVVSTSDAFIDIAARLSGELGLPTNSAAAIALCRDKLRLQDVLRDSGVAYPNTATIRSADAVARLSFPVIVKPRQGTGSIGVRLVESAQDFPRQFDDDLICQRFIPGTEFSVESFSDADGHQILGVTRKFVTKPPHFLELAHVFPADLDTAIRSRIVDTVRRALDAVGYSFGPAHTEVKVHDGAVSIIEINARLAGGMIPTLMERSFGWSMAELYVRSYLAGRSQFVVPTPALYSAVAFVVPEVGRRYVGIDFPRDCVDAGLFRSEGVNAGRFDFSDRAGYVISVGRSAMSALRQSLSLRMRSAVLYDDRRDPPPDAQTIHEIVYRKTGPSFGALTDTLLVIEKAHLTMLREQGMLSAAQFDALKQAVLALEADPGLLRDHVSGRGDYFDYENYVIDRCGRETGGMIQAARSRNDINSTHLSLTLREALSRVSSRTVDLAAVLARRANETTDVLLPIYSQYQTAMPGSAGHYLVAQGQILLDTLGALSALHDSLSVSPLGACAGAGTTFVTDTHSTAALLGFASGPSNSLRAISDKNHAQRGVYLLTELSGNLNRIASDLQLWTMRELALVALPDAMYGGSSNMPQKRNPYLLEWLRLGHERNAARLTMAVSSLSHLPTGNSYQASRTAIETLVESTGQIVDMLTVLTYAIDGARFDADAARRALEAGSGCATLAAELLVQQHEASFRDAHSLVGRALAVAVTTNATTATTAITVATEATPAEATARALLASMNGELAAGHVFERLSGGGGPSADNTRAAWKALDTQLRDARRHHLARDARAAALARELDRRFRRTL